ncbi:MAG: hypothetical protein MK212_22320, partial [Saprospiraceae bacterium]|nr:hypothetical protein [Saprospiraceae bacterium]
SPIKPRPLRLLVTEAPYIVYADVIDVTHYGWKAGPDKDEAVLLVKEVLQGRLSTDTLIVSFNSNLICPWPPSYKEGAKVLAFLRESKNEEVYKTCALSYGVKEIEEKGYRVYKERIEEMQGILKIKNKRKKEQATVDWLITCTNHISTRWEGVFDLGRSSDFMFYLDRRSMTIKPRIELSREQSKRLRTSCFSIDNLAYEDRKFIELIRQKEDKELLVFLIQDLKTSPIEDLPKKEFVMKLIVELTKREDLKATVSKIRKLDLMDKERAAKLIEIIKQFITQL